MPNSEHNSERNLNERRAEIDSAMRHLSVNSGSDNTGQAVSGGQVETAAEPPTSLRSNADLKWPSEMPNQGGKK